MAGAAAAGTGDHTRGRTLYLHPLHARIHILIFMMSIAAFRLAKEIFSTHEWALPWLGHAVSSSTPAPPQASPATQDTAAVGDSMDLLSGVPEPPPTGSGDAASRDPSAVLVMTQPGIIADAVQYCSDTMGAPEIYIDISTD